MKLLLCKCCANVLKAEKEKVFVSSKPTKKGGLRSEFKID